MLQLLRQCAVIIIICHMCHCPLLAVATTIVCYTYQPIFHILFSVTNAFLYR